MKTGGGDTNGHGMVLVMHMMKQFKSSRKLTELLTRKYDSICSWLQCLKPFHEQFTASVVDHEAPIIIGDSVSLLTIPDHITVVQESFRGPVEVSWIDRLIHKQLVAIATGYSFFFFILGHAAYGAHHLMSTGTTDTYLVQLLCEQQFDV